MRTLAWLTGVALCVAQGATPQTARDSEHLLHDAIIKKELYLRGFSAEPRISYRWNGTSLETKTPEVRTFAVLVPESLKVKRDRIVISGDRFTPLPDKSSGSKQVPVSTPVEIDINLGGTDAATVLPLLRSVLFYQDRDAAIADIPEDVRDYVQTGVRKQRSGGNAQKCDCADKGLPACQGKNPTIGLHQPRLLHAVEPEFSEEARQQRLSGKVSTEFMVDSSGHPIDIWIVRALGYGLDQKAVQAVNQYLFAPAVCHDKPVDVHLFVDVNFTIF